MIDFNDVEPARPAPEQLTTRAAIQARLIEIEDGIAAIRTQIAAADLKRQSNGTRIDADWFHRAKTALRHLERERAELRARMADLPGRKDRLKDRIIDVVREDYDDAAWDAVLDAARRACAEEPS
jgi:predicted transcriptional regulator